MKNIKYHMISVVILVITIFAFTAFADEAVDLKAGEFLKSYGWEVDKRCIEKSQVIIPEPFDLVYENYNVLQTEAGLDLKPYMGKKGMRYTYYVTNYPKDVNEPVRANVIIIDGKCVAGDICTVSLDGFIHSLAAFEKN